MSEKTSGKSEKTSEGNQVLERFEQVYRNYQRLSEKTQRIKRFEAMIDLLSAHNFLEERAKRNLIPNINFESTSPYVDFVTLRPYVRPKILGKTLEITCWFETVSTKELQSNDFTLKTDRIEFEICIIDTSFKTHLEATAYIIECLEYQKAPQTIKDIVQRLAELGFDHQRIELSGQGKLYSIDAFTIITTIENVALLEGIKMEIWKQEPRDPRQN